MKDLFNEYGRKARLYPAVVCLAPYLLLVHAALEQHINVSLLRGLELTIGDVSVSVVVIYALTQWHRFLSKALFQRPDSLPTTRMLMPGGQGMSSELRAKVDARVHTDFGLHLPTVTEAHANRPDSLLRVREIVSLIISRVGKGKLLLQHNIEYGFIRNLAGGALSATLVAAVGMLVFSQLEPNPAALRLAQILTAAYGCCRRVLGND